MGTKNEEVISYRVPATQGFMVSFWQSNKWINITNNPFGLNSCSSAAVGALTPHPIDSEPINYINKIFGTKKVETADLTMVSYLNYE